MKTKIKDNVKKNTKGIKAKVKAVVKKAKAKVKGCGAKCRKCATVAKAVLAAFCLAVVCSGCATSDSAQPAKSATMNNDFRDCIIVVAQKTTVSNGVVTAESTADAPAITLFQVAQNLENAGTDNTSQTTTQTPTVDVKPDVNVEVPVTKGDAAGAAADLVGAAASAVKAACSGSSSSGDCADGSCSYSGGSCTDGSCSP